VISDFLRRLRGEAALVERAQAVERERCARLAEAYGQRHLARIIRTPACPHCRGIGYDASGQTCWCQDNPSF
jgi:hypothetical protein